MKRINVKWDKVNPAELSSMECAQYFAFSKGKEVFLINEVDKKCLFTKVIQACANLSHSLYEIEIWAGYTPKGMNNFNSNSRDDKKVLEWSAKDLLKEFSLGKMPSFLERRA